MSEVTAENKDGLGGLQILPSGGAPPGVGAPPNPPTAAEAVVSQRKTRADAGKPRGPRAAAASGSVSPISSEVFAKLYSPEIWGKVAAAPADAICFATGDKTWEVTKEEKETLGITGSVAAQCFAVTDPRWLAASLFLLTIVEVYATRAAIYYRKKKEEKDAKSKP